VPPGKLDKERLLVQYRRLDPGKDATLEVTAADLEPSTDLAARLAGPGFGVQEWRLQPPPEPLDVNGVAGVRYDFAGRSGRDEMTREVVAFRRGGRVYFFTVVSLKKDATAREQFRRAVNGILWRG
jgi:hypothetical protein